MNKKGFTLIELLAVIVILAIIALIATPIILNVIEGVKKESAASSAYGYIHALEGKLVEDMFDKKNIVQGIYTIDNKGNITSPKNLTISVTGDKPTNGKLCMNKKGIITSGQLQINKYIIIYDGKKAKVDLEKTEIGEVDCDEPEQKLRIWEFKHAKEGQEFIVPYTGKYKIELWGASGGSSVYNGGYTQGNINLVKDQKYYIYVGETSITPTGGSGKVTPSTFNGGGSGGYGGTKNATYISGMAGGGATDIRLLSGAWDDINGLRSRIMVAGGGGGNYSKTDKATQAGGLTAYNGFSDQGNVVDTRKSASNQTSGASFGKGGNGANSGSATYCQGHSGGGGGYYGGFGGPGGYGMNCYRDDGAGGSSYISGHTGCVAVTSKDDTTPKANCVTGTTNNNCSIHYSNQIFTDTKMIDGAGYLWSNVKEGQQAMPKPDGGAYDIGVGHIGDGYAKITYLGA